MLYEIQFHSIPDGSHILAMPAYTHSVIVQCRSKRKLQAYIESKTDAYGYSFVISTKIKGFQYISSYGGVKVIPYKPPKIIKL